ncbi:helix-turn-helix domain-containing protein [Actinophytocola glycyrrhizae]|uniref:Multiprotein-bridging factor 1 family protein n=1 Tax=Actinophytocola glycyrrhizae TaxID=2044873 RepID=A0ABV9S1D1_9PSEU
MTEFGTLLRNLRVAAGMSLGELARQIRYSKGQVSKIENGHTKPSPGFARQCDHVLATGGTFSALLRQEPRRAETAPSEDVWVLELDEDGTLRYTEMPRRQVLMGAGALLGYAMSRSARPAIDERTFAGLRGSFDQHRALGTMMSPSLVIAGVIAHLHTLRTLAVDNPEPMRTELMLLAARVAEYAGWMSQEAGREADALRWTDRAVTFAADHDPHLASFALFRHAEVALYQHDPARTIELARMAQQDRTAGPRILGLAARIEAQGHALAGDVSGYGAALDRAAELLATREENDGPVLGPASVPDDLALVRGWSLYDLGRPGEAAAVLDRQLHLIPLTARRARARFGVRRALAHAQDSEVEQACLATWEVLADVAIVDSATIRLDLRELNRTLNRWHSHHSVRELRTELVPLLR